MDLLNVLMIIIPISSLVVSIVNILFERFFKSKNQYLEMKINDKKIEMMFNHNKGILLDDLVSFCKTQETHKDLVLKIINVYICKLSNALNDFYSNCNFDISIKRLDENSNTVYTLASTNLTPDNIVYKAEENTEFNSILNDHYRYFFVSDINEFDELIMPYKNSNANWKSLYKSSITIPIGKKQESLYHIIGFICITSPQSLNSSNRNKKIIHLLESTSNELYEILLKYQDSV